MRVGYIDGKIVINPPETELKNSRLDLIVAGTADAVVMVEAGAKELPEDTMIEAIRAGHETIQEHHQAIQQQLVAAAGKTQAHVHAAAARRCTCSKAVSGFVRPRFETAVNNADKAAREAAHQRHREDLVASAGAEVSRPLAKRSAGSSRRN